MINKPNLIIIDKFEAEIPKSITQKVNIFYNQQIDRDELSLIIGNYDYAVISTRIRFDKMLLLKAKKLKWIIRLGAGVDHIDLKLCKELGIRVCNTPNSNISTVNEYLFGQLLRVYKDYELHNRMVVEGRFRNGINYYSDLKGKTIAVIGVGRIGGRVAETAKVFDMKVIGVDPYLTYEQRMVRKVDLWTNLDEAIKIADIITLHVPLTDETRYFLNKSHYSSMKDGVVLANLARGELISLHELIESGFINKFKKIIIDVYEKEPFVPNINKDLLELFYFSPHAASYSIDSYIARANEAIDEIGDILAGIIPHGEIDPIKGY